MKIRFKQMHLSVLWPQYNSDWNKHKNCRRGTKPQNSRKQPELHGLELRQRRHQLSKVLMFNLFNTSWNVLLTLSIDEMYEIIINICLEICKKIFCQRKFQENTKYPETEGLQWKKYQNCKRKYKVNKSSNYRKCTKSDQKKLKRTNKNLINTEWNLRETRVIAAIKQKPKYFCKFVKKQQLNDQSSGIGPLQDEEGNLEPSNKKNERTT